MSIKLCFYFVLIYAIAHNIPVTAFQPDCPSSKCSCSQVSYGTYEYNCNPMVSLTDTKTYYYGGDDDDYVDEARRILRVTCSDVNAAAYDTLSEMSIGNVEVLAFDGCGLPPGSFANGVSSLKDFSFTNKKSNAIGSLRPAHFDGIDELEKLSIQINSTQEWPNDLLDRFRSVTQLSLQVPNLNARVLKNFSNLHLATIGYDLTDIDGEIFANGNGLWSLILIGNRFAQLKLQPFQSQIDMKYLTLDSNTIGEIEANAFSAFEKIETVELLNNHIGSLPHGLFSNNTKLKMIKIIGGHLGNLPGEWLANLDQLKNVYIIRANLTSVPGNLFKGSSYIVELDLSQNKLTTLPSELFADVKGLEEINLSENLLTSLPENLFDSFHSLRRLNLTHNQFKSVAAAITKRPSSHTRDIYLGHNQIADIFPEDLNVIEEDVTVDLAHNLITHVNASKWILDRHIGFSGRFQLQHNPIDCGCTSTAFLRLLHHYPSPLDLVDAKCATPERFAGKNLKDFQINEIDCGLTYHYDQPAECTFTADDSKTVLIMNCSNAGLSEVPPIPTSDQIALKSVDLYIENNSIQSLPELYRRNYSHVQNVYARNNLISELSYVNIPIKLQTIDVSHNRLTSLSIEVMASLDDKRFLKKILWNDNPWTFEYPIDLPDRLLKKKILTEAEWNTDAGDGDSKSN